MTYSAAPQAGDFDSEKGWPPAVEIVNEQGASDIVLLCEHASAYVPEEYGRLGLSEAELHRHIGWDIGAAAVTRHLAALLDAPAFLGTYSRLLIDLNRPPEVSENGANVPASIPVRSERTDIPGNIGISAEEITRRKTRIFNPYHDCVASHLDKRRDRKTRLVTIHSFTPVYMEDVRPWHCGVLFNKSRAYAERILSVLDEENSLVVGANVPYTITEDADYAIPIHGEARGLDSVLIELRQDLISDEQNAREWAQRLAKALS